MSESDYLEWVKAGKPDEWGGKVNLVVRWWKTDPTLEQRAIITKFRNIDLFLGFCLGGSLAFVISALLIAIII